jgi:hypothetical protein
MVLNLTEDEKRVLTILLDITLAELKMEISHTEKKDFRQELKHEKDVLISILERVRKEG